MQKKLPAAILAVTALSFGLAHAQTSSSGSAKPMTKAEAAKAGISEARFKALDTNGDGVLDAQEQSAAGGTSSSGSSTSKGGSSTK